MTSHPPAQCCTVGVTHEGEAKGEYTTLENNGTSMKGFSNLPSNATLTSVRPKLTIYQNITVECYLAYPADRSTKRGVLILTDVIGHRYINAQLIADQMAANGFFVAMPDLFHGDPIQLNRPPGFDVMAWLKGPPGHLPDRVDPVVKNAIEFMRKKGCEKIGGVGYCFGVSYQTITGPLALGIGVLRISLTKENPTRQNTLSGL